MNILASWKPPVPETTHNLQVLSPRCPLRNNSGENTRKKGPLTIGTRRERFLFLSLPAATTLSVDMPPSHTTSRKGSIVRKPLALQENHNHYPHSLENKDLRARCSDRGKDRVFVILRAMKYLAQALKRLDIPFAVTGSLVGYEYRIERLYRNVSVTVSRDIN